MTRREVAELEASQFITAVFVFVDLGLLYVFANTLHYQLTHGIVR